ncbi:MAG: phosphopantothenate/pantothenate synthetase [Methanoregulaceae archaeon]|nr:phosphopantothenate/pantothenate synthetase [Methanoregulaceae archaeon]
MIPKDHPRFHSLKTRELLARYAAEGIVTLEGLTAHGRGEAFDYLIGEKTMESARKAAKAAAALLLSAQKPIISVNGNTAALAADQIRDLQEASGAEVEVNLFHRTEERMEKVSRHLEERGVRLLSGEPEHILPLLHGRGLCLREGIGSADVILVPLEDGDRVRALTALGRTVIVIDLNPLSRSAREATLTIVDELTRALPVVTRYCREIEPNQIPSLACGFDNRLFLEDALSQICRRLEHALD